MNLYNHLGVMIDTSYNDFSDLLISQVLYGLNIAAS